MDPSSKQQIAQLKASIEADFQEGKPFDMEKFKSDIQSNFRNFQDRLIDMSENCLQKLSKWNQGLDKMIYDVNEVGGVLASVKTDVGSRILNELILEGGGSRQEIVQPTISSSYKINLPNYIFTINTRNFEQIGRESSQMRSDTDFKSNPPLILKIKPGEKQPEFWNRSIDFVIPDYSIASSIPSSELVTSFGEYYKTGPLLYPDPV